MIRSRLAWMVLSLALASAVPARAQIGSVYTTKWHFTWSDTGEPASGLPLRLYEQQRAREWLFVTTVYTDADGAAEFNQVSMGSIRFLIYLPERWPVVEGVASGRYTEGDRLREVYLSLPRRIRYTGSLCLDVYGAPRGVATATLVGIDGNIELTTDDEGRIVYGDPIPAGAYLLVVDRPGFRRAAHALEIGQDRTNFVRIDLVPE